jgi:hypothetical protein
MQIRGRLTVFWNIVKVVPPDNESSLHLGADHPSSQDSSTDADVPREWAFLVNVVSIDRLIGSLEPKSNVLVPALGNSKLSPNSGLGILEKVLFLESFLDLSVQ